MKRTTLALAAILWAPIAPILATSVALQSDTAAAQTLEERLDAYIELFWVQTIGGGDHWLPPIIEESAQPFRDLNPGREELVDEALRATFVDGLLAVSLEPRRTMARVFRQALSDEELAEMLDFFESPIGHEAAEAHFVALSEAVFAMADLQPHLLVAFGSRAPLEFKERALRYE